MSVTVKLAKEIDQLDIIKPTAECQLMTPCERRLATQRDDLRSVQGEEDTDERVKTSHTEKCEKSENLSCRRPRWKSCRTRKRPCQGVSPSRKKELASSVTSAPEKAKVISSLHPFWFFPPPLLVPPAFGLALLPELGVVPRVKRRGISRFPCSPPPSPSHK